MSNINPIGSHVPMAPEQPAAPIPSKPVVSEKPVYS